MECDICRTLAQQMRSYEMEIKEAREGLSRLRAGVTAASLLNSALEEARKTKLLYQRHRESLHKPDRSQPAIQLPLKIWPCENRDWLRSSIQVDS